MVLGIGLFLGIQCWDNVIERVSKEREAYEEAADWLYDQTKDIYEPTTLVIDCEDVRANRAWYNFYLTKEGLRDDINCVSYHALDMTTLLNYEKIYMVRLHEAYEEDEKLQDFLETSVKYSGGNAAEKDFCGRFTAECGGTRCKVDNGVSLGVVFARRGTAALYAVACAVRGKVDIAVGGGAVPRKRTLAYSRGILAALGRKSEKDKADKGKHGAFARFVLAVKNIKSVRKVS